MRTLATLIVISTLGLQILWLGSTGFCDAGSAPIEPTVTVLCYMNGDNDLAQEVLHALDMMETVGSSDRVNVIALVDGHPGWLGPYADDWSETRLLHLQADPQTGLITSPVIEEWGEADLGSPETLQRFICRVLSRYPAKRYIFYTFAHGRGVIDTRNFEDNSRPVKTVSMSHDDTSGKQMTLEQFHGALKIGLNGGRFDMMVLFSCLANMVEVGYSLKDVTRYLVGSQDEIRLVNQPPGRYQIRGLEFERLIAELKRNSAADVKELGRGLVDSHVANYEQDVMLPAGDGNGLICRFDGSMSLVDVEALPGLARALDSLARELFVRSKDPSVARALKKALSATQPFASFLNLEYYDLHGFLSRLRRETGGEPALETACTRVLNLLTTRVLLYSRHTSERRANGISIYFPHPLVPENIFQAHQAQYRENRFSRDTHWDEMIDLLRPLLKETLLSKPDRSSDKKKTGPFSGPAHNASLYR